MKKNEVKTQMILSLKNFNGQICVCEKGSGNILCAIADTHTSYDIPINDLIGISELLNEEALVTYANYRLKAALAKASLRVSKGICLELALFPLKQLFVRSKTCA